MSPQAIDRRLRDVGQLYKLAMALRSARPLGRKMRAEHEALCVVDPDRDGPPPAPGPGKR
ncbi:MAG TPA: hypothetical protein VGG06_06785 [Thermoanaerobaculia bacterium]|jgi:hypothetical protein